MATHPTPAQPIYKQSAENTQQLLELYQQHGHSFNYINLATCWTKLAKLDPAVRVWLLRHDGAWLVSLREQTLHQLSSFQARSVANTAYALSKLDLRSPA